MTSRIVRSVWAVLVGASLAPLSAAEYQSHAPTRPLPTASSRPMAAGPAKFVDAARGDDAADGSEAKPWRTLAHAVTQLAPGDTLYLRAGTYFERVATTLVGTAEKPITIRSYPGELVVVDGGLPEFELEPATAWEPYADGAPGEFRSTKTYPDIETTAGDLQVSLLGRFVDSMQPLHGYWHHADLQSDNPYWTLGGGEKVRPDAHVYCGPGLWYDEETDRIHVRLAHTQLPGLHDDNYRGETDPRKIPLVVAGWGHGPVLALENSQHVRLQDLVLRGCRRNTLDLRRGAHLELDGLTLYGGHSCLSAEGCYALRVAHTACRGLAAPWTFRGSLKYRSIESRLVRTGGWDPTGRDGRMYEFAYSEFTDSVDGVFIGNIGAVFFHHNLVENISDDAIFVTANTAYDGTTNGGGSYFYQNRFARNLTCFAFGVGHGRQKTIADGASLAYTKRQRGGGLTICRNVFDFRRPVMYHWPAGPDDEQEITSLGRFAGDHGSPAWEDMRIYHNTILAGDEPRYEYGTDGFSRAMGGGSVRRVANNIICQLRGLPGNYLPPGDADFFADHNLLWSVSAGPTTAALPKARYPRDQAPPSPEWGAHDRFADPQFAAFDADWRRPVDLRLNESSPAVDAGRSVESESGEFADPLASLDERAPDVGALPLGVAPWPIGVGGRLDVCGNPTASVDPNVLAFEWKRPSVVAKPLPTPRTGKPAVIVTGYPAFDAPLIAYTLRKHGVEVVELDKQWLDPREYDNYSTVVVDGSFLRGKITPDHYSAEELPIVKKFLDDGGTLWLFRDRQDLFSDLEARRFLLELTGGAAGDRSLEFVVKQPDHPWVRHLRDVKSPAAAPAKQAAAPAEPDLLDALDAKSARPAGNPPAVVATKPAADAPVPWFAKAAKPLSVTRGEVIIGTNLTNAVLARVSVGKGQLIYVGFSPAASIPGGREASTVAEEETFEAQMQVLANIVESLYPAR